MRKRELTRGRADPGRLIRRLIIITNDVTRLLEHQKGRRSVQHAHIAPQEQWAKMGKNGKKWSKMGKNGRFPITKTGDLYTSKKHKTIYSYF